MTDSTDVLNQRLEKFKAAKLLTTQQATMDVVQKVVGLLSDEEVDELIGLILKIKAYADPIPCPPPIDNLSLSQPETARSRAKKKKKK